jgi:hypothetical protein
MLKRKLSLSALPDEPSGDPDPQDDQRGDFQPSVKLSHPVQASTFSSTVQQRK